MAKITQVPRPLFHYHQFLEAREIFKHIESKQARKNHNNSQWYHFLSHAVIDRSRRRTTRQDHSLRRDINLRSKVIITELYIDKQTFSSHFHYKVHIIAAATFSMDIQTT